ncbi:MAG: hypothetical protein COB78_07905 [Hyphomicrobiales bacterium]|nr:MAG: hypothetical protein COB78_07905 [Hyphomicrobiales bacterium]
MRNNASVEKLYDDRNISLYNSSSPQSGAPEKTDIIIEHRASSGETFATGDSGVEAALKLFSPRDNAKKEHIAWAYFKACVTGFIVSVLLVSFLVDSNAPAGATPRLFMNLLSGMIMMMVISPLMLIPIRILADIFQFFGVKRGTSDVLIGAISGSVMMLTDIARGIPTSSISFCFILGGAAGGFAYWRYRGYPQTGDIQETSGEPSPVVQRF